MAELRCKSKVVGVLRAPTNMVGETSNAVVVVLVMGYNPTEGVCQHRCYFGGQHDTPRRV